MKPTDETFYPLTARKIELCGDYFADCNLLADAIAQDMKAYEELERERNELTAQVERLRGMLQDKAAKPVCCGNGSGDPQSGFSCCGCPDFTLPEDVVAVLSEQPPATLAALKAQWQADQYADGMPAQKAFWEGFERGAVKGPVNIRSHWEEWKSFSQRAQEAGDAAATI